MITARAVSVVLAGGLVLAALMTGAALWPRSTPAPAGLSADGAAELSVQTDMGLLEAQVTLLPDLAYELDVHVDRDADAVGQIRPTLVISLMDTDIEPMKPPLHVLSANEFHGEGRFAMPGRWRFQLGFGEDLHDMEVVVTP